MEINKSTFYNNISGMHWKAVTFSMLNDQTSIKEIPVLFNNGMLFNINDMLMDCTDFKCNNKTGLFLTGLRKAEDFLQDKTTQNNKDELKIIRSPLGTITPNTSSTVVKLTSINNRIFSNLITSNSYSFNDLDVFNFIFYPEGYVMVIDKNNNYLTSKTGQSTNNLTFEPKIFPDNQAQQFDYFLGETTISLFEIDDEKSLPRFKNVVTYSSETNGVYYLSPITETLSSSFFSYKNAFELFCFNKNSDFQQNNIKNSFLAKYLISPVDDNKDLTLDEDILNSQYSQNYIGIFPNEYAIETDKNYTFPLVTHALKNYQTPEYKYSFGFEIIEGQNGVRRIYDKIFSGTNQTGGHKNLFLGFNSNTLEYNFKPDSTTDFYFPPTSERIHIKDSGLIEDGAIPGEIPYTSDRIFVKKQNYEEIIPDSPQPESLYTQSNTWVCSWLSGSINGDKIWMDRYYNPAYYTLDQVLSTKTMVYNDKLSAGMDYTFDIPSQMYFEPGALYKYTHIGQSNRKTFLNYFSSNSILQVTNWTSDKLQYDYEDAYGIVYFNNNTENYKKDYIQLDGTNHVLFPATTKLLEQYKLTVSLWLNVNDWNYIDGSQIFGNYYNSGYGLINESSVTTPIISLIDKEQNKIYNLNYKFSLLNILSANNVYSKTNITPQNEYIQRLNDFNYWVFDKKNKTGIKFNIDNQSIAKVNFEDNALSNSIEELKEISQIEIDGNENIYFYDNLNKKCVSFNTYGVYLSSYNFSQTTNRIEIDLNGNILSIYGSHSVIDNYNNIWEIVGGNLYKNKKIFGNIGIVEQITCDSENNIWILHDQDSITKIDTVLNKIPDGFPKRISKSSSLEKDPCYDYSIRRRYLNFVRVPRDSNSDFCEITNKATEDRLILLDKIDNQIYILNQGGDLIIKLNLLALGQNTSSSVIADGDFTGYSYLRKFSSVNKKLSWKIKIAHPNGKNGKLLILPIEVGSLSKGWHNFSLIFDSNLGYATSYIDTLSSSSVSFDPQQYQIYYDYRTSLLLGAETVKNTTLNDIIDINDGYKFIGKIAELRVYNKSLSEGELQQIYYSSPLASQDRDLIWNMNVGERSYVEEIAHWFKLQLPGSKSKYYNINIHNFPTNDEVKMIIEDSIRENIYKISPAQTELYKINWV
jgi:hypothetical protein